MELFSEGGGRTGDQALGNKREISDGFQAQIWQWSTGDTGKSLPLSGPHFLIYTVRGCDRQQWVARRAQHMVPFAAVSPVSGILANLEKDSVQPWWMESLRLRKRE